MNPNDVIESYVADVIRRVPLKERNDIGVELRTLLTEMLDERAQAAGQAPDDAMVLAMLREFGAPADIAARYRAPGFVILPPEQTRSFAWLSLGGIALQWALTLPRVAEGQSITAWWLTWGLGAFWWPGFLSMMALFAAWIRQWRTTPPAWSPRDVDPDRVHRGAMAFGLTWYAIGVALMICLPWIAAQLPEPFPRLFVYDPDFLRTRAWLIVLLWVDGLRRAGARAGEGPMDACDAPPRTRLQRRVACAARLAHRGRPDLRVAGDHRRRALRARHRVPDRADRSGRQAVPRGAAAAARTEDRHAPLTPKKNPGIRRGFSLRQTSSRCCVIFGGSSSLSPSARRTIA